MLAFSPFIPMDANASSLPAAMFEFEVVNPTKKPIRYSLFGSLGNPVKGAHSARVAKADGMTGMVNYVASLQPSAREFGEVMIATDESDVSWQHEWYRGSWFDTLEVYWKDLTTPGKLKDRVYKDAHVDRRIDGGGRHRGHSTLAAHKTVKPGERATFRFVISWYFPTAEKYWLYLSGYSGETKELGRTWKNHYATLFPGVEAVSSHVIAQWDRLRDEHAVASATRCANRRCRTRCSTPSPPISASSRRRPCCAWKTARSTASKAATRKAELRGQLRPCLELPAGGAVPLPRSRAQHARGRLPV